ncbi:hypothetical protein K438DRAFT_1938892 [Mycena galopus ATCC 62051]|nr:hypothetical protein K438DRAFT_1938892 [Mycena galopus ATCC 62051]
MNTHRVLLPSHCGLYHREERERDEGGTVTSSSPQLTGEDEDEGGALTISTLTCAAWQLAEHGAPPPHWHGTKLPSVVAGVLTRCEQWYASRKVATGTCSRDDRRQQWRGRPGLGKRCVDACKSGHPSGSRSHSDCCCAHAREETAHVVLKRTVAQERKASVRGYGVDEPAPCAYWQHRAFACDKGASGRGVHEESAGGGMSRRQCAPGAVHPESECRALAAPLTSACSEVTCPPRKPGAGFLVCCPLFLVPLASPGASKCWGSINQPERSRGKRSKEGENQEGAEGTAK